MESFEHMLSVGKPNSLGRVDEVIDAVMHDPSRLEELYNCLFNNDAWLRMRAADALEKVARRQPNWLQQYIDRLNAELSTSNQPSVLWHLAQIYSEVPMTPTQQSFAAAWLQRQLSTPLVDWIVAGNAMKTVMHFVIAGIIKPDEAMHSLDIQTKHHSKAVVKLAHRLLDELKALRLG